MKTYVPKAGSVWAAVVTLSISSLSLAACGGGGGLSTEDQALADAIAKDSVTPGLIDESQAQCFGDDLVKTLGAKRLDEMGVTVENPQGLDSSEAMQGLTDDEANTIVDTIDKCVGVKKIMTDLIAADTDEEAATCVVDKVGDDEIRALLKVSFLEQEPTEEQMTVFADAVTECDAG